MGASGSAYPQGQVRLSDQFIQVAGDAAYELGIEHVQVILAGQPVTGDVRVTNIYRRRKEKQARQECGLLTWSLRGS